MITQLKYKEESSEYPVKYMNEHEFDRLKDKIIVVLEPASRKMYMLTSSRKDQYGLTYILARIAVGMGANKNYNVVLIRPEDLLNNNEYKVYMLDKLGDLKDLPDYSY